MTRLEPFFSWGESWILPTKTASATLRGARRQERAGSLLVAPYPRRPLGEWLRAEALPERAGSLTSLKSGRKHKAIS
jgi:hypothetical protein